MSRGWQDSRQCQENVTLKRVSHSIRLSRATDSEHRQSRAAQPEAHNVISGGCPLFKFDHGEDHDHWHCDVHDVKPEPESFKLPAASEPIKDVVSLAWSGEAMEMENLFIILRLVRQYKLGRKGRSSRPGPARL